MFKKNIKNIIVVLLITILLCGIVGIGNAESNYITVIIKSNGGTDGVGRIEVGQSQMMILSPAIPEQGRSITGYSFNGTKYFTTNGSYTNGNWTYSDDTIVVDAETKTATKKCPKCSVIMEYHSTNDSECSWKHPENECEYSNVVYSETHVWEDATCVIKPYCTSCYTEKTGGTTNVTHNNLEIIAGTCSENGGVIPHKHCPACDTYFTMDGTALANKNAVIRKEKGCTWTKEKWIWTINKDNTASYVLHIECSNCGKVVDYKGKSPVAISQTSKTIKPTCTTEGTNYYTTEIVYEGSTFVGEHTEKIPAKGHSFEKETSIVWSIAKDELEKQYHFRKCTNADCPDKGIVDAATCTATDDNAATCEKKSKCDICYNEFGDILQHEYENGACKLCKQECVEHEWEIGICTICNLEHKEHLWKEGICSECGYSSEEHEWEMGVCKECQAKHEDHKWKDGTCMICHLIHDHDGCWEDGICNECSYVHQTHSWKNGQCTICQKIHTPHEWEQGACITCDVKCEHAFIGATCSICEFAEYKVFLSSQCVHALNSKESINIDTNGSREMFKELLINGSVVGKQHLAISDNGIVIMPNYLDTLNVGEYEVIIRYTNGEVSSQIIITEAVKNTTKISTIIAIIAIVVLVLAVAAGGVIFYIYKIREDEYYDDDDYDNEDDDPPPPPASRTIAENVVARKAQEARKIPTPPTQPTQPINTVQRQTSIVLTTDEEKAILDKVNREMQVDLNKYLNKDNE